MLILTNNLHNYSASHDLFCNGTMSLFNRRWVNVKLKIFVTSFTKQIKT